MYLLTLVCFVAVVVLKYYTTRQMAAYKRKIQNRRNELAEAKKRHRTAVEKHEVVSAMEDLHKRRVKYARDLVADMRMRIAAVDNFSVPGMK